MKAPGLLFLALYGKVPSLDGAYVVTDIENFRTYLGTFAQIHRDVLRLQIHLVSANVAARASRNGEKMAMLFFSSCRPMPDLFRCEDLVKNQGMDAVWQLLQPLYDFQLPYEDASNFYNDLKILTPFHR
jgi:hypothetical protein